MFNLRASDLMIFPSMFLLFSCVPKSQLAHQYDRGYKRGQSQCMEYNKTYTNYLEKDVALKTEKLRQFNLVDEKGNLRTKEGKK